MKEEALVSLRDLGELREWARLDEAGRFRPLRAAPDLRRGWRYRTPDLAGLRAALDYLYPAELANWLLWREERLEAAPWHSTAERQTGRFRIVRELGEPGLAGLVEDYCERGCLKTRLWPPAGEPLRKNENELPLLCPEACNFPRGQGAGKAEGAWGRVNFNLCHPEVAPAALREVVGIY